VGATLQQEPKPKGAKKKMQTPRKYYILAILIALCLCSCSRIMQTTTVTITCPTATTAQKPAVAITINRQQATIRRWVSASPRIANPRTTTRDIAVGGADAATTNLPLPTPNKTAGSPP
jgi:hypothetical protein